MDGPGPSNLRPELSSLCEQWQSRQGEALSARAEQMARAAVSAISAPAESAATDFGFVRAEIERLWSQELQVTVHAPWPSPHGFFQMFCFLLGLRRPRGKALRSQHRYPNVTSAA